MASLPFKIYKQLLTKKSVELFGSYGDFSEGQQLRDFIYVNDIIDIMICTDNNINGIYNLGTSVSRTFNDLALACLNSFYQLNINSESIFL